MKGSLWLAFVLLLACGTANSFKEATPPSPSQLAGVWVGFDNDELEFTRLDLRTDFTGFCARVSPSDTVLHDYGVDTYRITKWGMDGWTMRFNLAPVGSKAEPIYLEGSYNGFSMRLKVGNRKTKWERKLTLFRESRFNDSNEETKAKLQEMEKQ